VSVLHRMLAAEKKGSHSRLVNPAPVAVFLVADTGRSAPARESSQGPSWFQLAPQAALPRRQHEQEPLKIRLKLALLRKTERRRSRQSPDRIDDVKRRFIESLLRSRPIVTPAPMPPPPSHVGSALSRRKWVPLIRHPSDTRWGSATSASSKCLSGSVPVARESMSGPCV